MKTPQHILVIRLSAMGDVAMTVPVVYAFAKANPDVKITFLSKASFKPIIETLPNIQFMTADIKESHKGLMGLWRLSRELKALKITHIADMHNVLRSKILRFFLKLPNAVIDKGRAEKKALTRPKNKEFKALKTTVQRYVEVLTALGFESFKPTVVSKPTSNEAVIDFIGQDTKRWIGIAPFAAHKGKQYPLELMRKVLVTLDKQPEVHLFLLGGAQEKKQLQVLSRGINSCTVVAGALKFRDEINFIAQLDVMLSMDSGNAHLAALFGIPAVTLWGNTHPYAGFAPFEQEDNCILSDREKYPLIPTSVYGNKVLEGYDVVMRSIAPEAVVKKISEL